MKYNYLSKILIALVLLFALVACGGTETPTPQADPTEVIAPTEAVTAPTEAPTAEAAPTEEAATEGGEAATYTVDTEASTLEWYGERPLGSTENGIVQIAEGQLTLMGTELVDGSIVIDMTTIEPTSKTGDMLGMLTGHLKSDDFFAVETYPTATLVIKSAEPTDVENQYRVTADLTIKATTDEIQFLTDVVVGDGTLAATAEIIVDRSIYDVQFGSGSFFDNLGDDLISDEMRMTVSLETAAPAEPTVETMMRDSGLLVTVHDYGDVVVHSVTAPEQVFANSTHIIETPNNLVLIDTQFLLPNAMDFRAYADSLGKPIDRVFITHHHPDHFLGSEAFADLDVFSLAETSAAIAEVGQAEVDEKQADFGAAIASTFVVPQVVEPGTMEIDGVPFEFSLIKDAEAENQLVIRLPEQDIIAVGDIVYSGVHLIMAGAPPTWIEALNTLKSMGSEQTIVLAGHGVPGGADLYDANIAWLAKAGELIGTVSTGEEWKAGLIEAFPDLGMPAAMDFVAPFLFPEESTVGAGLIEVITVELAEGATVEAFLPANQVIEDEYAALQPGYLARETAVAENNLVRLSVHWESKADSDASIAGFGEAPGLEAFMGNLNAETMVIKQYELLSSTSGQVTFSGAGVTEVITVRLQDGADTAGFLAANQALEESYIVEQPGFVAREIGLSEDGEWLIVIHWETAEDSAASIAKFGEAPGVEAFMSFLDAETMAITVYDIQQ